MPRTKGIASAGAGKRSARSMPDLYVKAPTLADEFADDERWHRAQAVYATRPSTSDVPWRCQHASCQEWNAAHRAKCRYCGARRGA